ncbi:ATP synthase gamma chain [Streptomyces alboniger]
MVFTEFVSMMTQTALDDRLLPLSLDEVAQESATKDEILPLFDFEPSAEDVLDALLPRYVESRIYNALLQSAASKHAATRRAMKSATDNAGELIETPPALPTRPARPKSPGNQRDRRWLRSLGRRDRGE